MLIQRNIRYAHHCTCKELTDEESIKAAKRKEIEAKVAAARKQMEQAAAAKKDPWK